MCEPQCVKERRYCTSKISLSSKKKKIIALYVFDRILGKRIINNNIAFVFLIFKS